MKRLISAIIISASLSATFVACEKYEETPSVNDGYATSVIIPDPVPMTAEDSAYVDAVKAEYDQNAK